MPWPTYTPVYTFPVTSATTETVTWATNRTNVTWANATTDWTSPATPISALYRDAAQLRALINETIEAREARLRRAAAQDVVWQAQVEADRIERQRAIERAEILLQESLSPQQQEELSRCGFFTVATQLQNGHPRIYQLRRGRVANILEVNAQGHGVSRWCVHPRLDVPDADTLLAQKLWLENRPDELLAIANRHPV